MQEKDLEKTQILPQNFAGQAQNQDSLPQPAEQNEQPAAYLGKNTRVSEVKSGPVAKKKTQGLTAGKKRLLACVLGFAAAIFIGFSAAGYYYEQQHDKEQQELAWQQKNFELLQQEQKLKEQRQQLEKKQRELEEQKQQLAQTSANIAGRNQQLADEKPDTVLGQLVDKVTGKEQQRQQQMADNEAAGQSLADKAQEIAKSADDAQQMLDDVDAKLTKIRQMQQDASEAKAKLTAFYDENSDTFDQVVHYAKLGWNLIEKYI